MRHPGRVTLVGFWSLPDANPGWLQQLNSWPMKYRFGWPFGRLALTDDAIVLSVGGPLGRVFSLLTRRTSPRPRLVLPLAQITGVDVWGTRPTVISFDCR